MQAPPDQDPLEASFPIGNGLVARCVATGLPFQTRHGGGGDDAATGGVSPAPLSSRRFYGNTSANNNNNSGGNVGAINVALTGPADLHALPLPERYDLDSPSRHAAATGVPPLSTVSFQGQCWKKKQQQPVAGRDPGSASTAPPPPASWENHGARPPGGSPVLGSGGGGGGGRGRGRSRLAFFPANDDYGSSRSPSPAGPVGAVVGARGYGFLSNSPPPVGGGVGGRDSRRWWSESESPSPRQRQEQRQRSLSPSRARRAGVGMPKEEEDEGVVLHVACLPVTGGDGGQAMVGVLKVG